MWPQIKFGPRVITLTSLGRGCACVRACPPPLPPAAAIAGRVKAAIELLRCGADLGARNQYGATANDLARQHQQVAVQVFLDPAHAQASIDAQPRYAHAERSLVWAQRKRRAAVSERHGSRRRRPLFFSIFFFYVCGAAVIAHFF